MKTHQDTRCRTTLGTAFSSNDPPKRFFGPKCQAAICLLLILGCLSQTRAAVDVSGTIVNATWTKDKSPYNVVGDILVAGLKIEPGVQVLFQSNYVFEVAGILTAIGKAEEPIIFTGTNGGWQGIYFNYSSPGSEMHNCIISNAVNSGVRIAKSLPYFERCTFANNTSFAGSGGGIYVDIVEQGDLILRGCSISNNTSRYNGGGVWANMSKNTLVLEHCEFRSNIANPSAYGGTYHGGGLGVVGGLRMRNCLVADNMVRGGLRGLYANGGGVHSEGRAEVNNCVFQGNNARAGDQDGFAHGGGMTAMGSGPLTLANSIFSYNICSGWRGNWGGGVYVGADRTSPRVVNCTLVYNNIQGMYVDAPSTKVMNSILFFNSDGGIQIAIDSRTNVTYCDVQGGFPGESNINFQPIFQSTSHPVIVPGSRCIDAGNPDPAYNDVAFPPSLGGVRNDMGAHGGPGAIGWLEGDMPTIVQQPQSQSTYLGQSVTFSLLCTGAEPLSHQWYFNDVPLANQTGTNLVLANLQSEQGGRYSVVVSNSFGSVTSAPALLVVYDARVDLEMYAGLTISGLAGRDYIVSCTTDLNNTNWTALATNTLGDSDWFFLDMDSPFEPKRFYKANLKR